MPTEENRPQPSLRTAGRRADWYAGASLGLLLGLLMGFTTSPVASIVVTGLVALLAGLFGLSDKLAPAFSAGAARRLTAFGLAAVLMIPLAVWVRVHEILGPSVEQQRQTLREIGIVDAAEQKEMLRFLRFGLLPAGATATGKDAPASAGGRPFLYARPTKFCDELLGLRAVHSPLADFEKLFATSGTELEKMGKALSALPAEQRQAAFDAAPAFLCAT